MTREVMVEKLSNNVLFQKFAVRTNELFHANKNKFIDTMLGNENKTAENVAQKATQSQAQKQQQIPSPGLFPENIQKIFVRLQIEQARAKWYTNAVLEDYKRFLSPFKKPSSGKK